MARTTGRINKPPKTKTPQRARTVGRSSQTNTTEPSPKSLGAAAPKKQYQYYPYDAVKGTNRPHGGVPTKWSPRIHIPMAHRVFVTGYTITEFAERAKISYVTAYHWFKTKPELAEARRVGEELQPLYMRNMARKYVEVYDEETGKLKFDRQLWKDLMVGYHQMKTANTDNKHQTSGQTLNLNITLDVSDIPLENLADLKSRPNRVYSKLIADREIN